MKTVRRPPYPKWNPGYFPCSSLTPPSAFLTPSIGVLRWIRGKAASFADGSVTLVRMRSNSFFAMGRVGVTRPIRILADLSTMTVAGRLGGALSGPVSGRWEGRNWIRHASSCRDRRHLVVPPLSRDGPLDAPGHS